MATPTFDQTKEAPKFRSVLPHEPLPEDEYGYIHVQGSFEPKKQSAEGEANESAATTCAETPSYHWTKPQLQESLKGSFWNLARRDLTNDWTTNKSCFSVHVLDESPPFTKIRLTLPTPTDARHLVASWKEQNLSPRQVLATTDNEVTGSFSSRPLQLTLVTTAAMPSTDCAWTRSSPPKFRRLLQKPGQEIQKLQQERQTTRFLFISGLVDSAPPDAWTSRPFAAIDAIRYVVQKFDTSGMGVEVFLQRKKNLNYCHIGMRSNDDANAVLAALQGQTVEWKLQENSSFWSGKLFVDYAGITHRSAARAVAREHGEDDVKGKPSRSECTSTTDHVVVPGLQLLEDFLGPDEERALMAVLTGPQAPWAPSQKTMSQEGVVKRRVQHYGYVFDYETANVLRDRSAPKANCPPMPGLLPTEQQSLSSSAAALDQQIQEHTIAGQGWSVLSCILEKVRRHVFSTSDGTSQCYNTINQMTVNHYEPGEGIGSHVDTPSAFGEGLISITLNGGTVMEFRQAEGGTGKKLVYLPPRSLLLMSGPARYTWEHMMVNRKTDTHKGVVIPRVLRVSLTLRTALDKSGEPLPRVETCQFPPVWGTPKNESVPLVTPATEREHVHAVYDAIATQWHHTRGKRGVLWPGATQFLESLSPGSIVADVGCGDGKYFPAIWNAGSYVIGTDISLPLLQTSAYQQQDVTENRRVHPDRKHFTDRPAVAVADCMHLPMRSQSCDAAICIAVLHHLSTPERRLRCIQELARIVKPGGKINVQAWALEQEEGSRRKFASTDVFVPFNAQPKYLDKVVPLEQTTCSKSVAEQYSEAYQNADFDEAKGLVVFQRYCHLYRKGELEDIVAGVPNVTIVESGYESGNHFVILRKLDLQRTEC